MNRRSFLLGLSSALAAPAIVRVGSLMPVRLVDWDATRIYDPLTIHQITREAIRTFVNSNAFIAQSYRMCDQSGVIGDSLRFVA